jgi:Ca-activated chloride channel family protein
LTVGLLAPLALLALPLLGVIVALYLLKLRRPTAPIGSLHLWETLTRDREANSLWQRLRVSALLLLQLIILGVLILALARPWVPSTEVVGQNVVVIVDVSASMGARDREGGPTRMQQARERARAIIDGLPQSASAMLLAAGDRVTVVVPSTDDHGRLKGAIDRLAVQAVEGDMEEALKLAGAVAAREANSAIWLVSDGSFPPADSAVESLPGALTFVPVGEGDRSPGARGNQGITALSLQKDQAGLSLFIQVSNSEIISASRRIDLLADESPWTARNVEIGPGGTQEVVIEDVPIGARVVQARFAGVDTLDLDDRAWVVNRASVPANVLLVTDENKFLELSLALLPTVTLYKVKPGDYSPEASLNGLPFDLTIFDAGVPITTLQTLPAGSIMMFAPPVSNPLVSVTGVLTEPLVTSTAVDNEPEAGDRRDPLLKFVDLSNIHISTAARMGLPAWGRAVASSGSDPLIVAGEESGRNVVVFAFDLHNSDLPLQTAFPLLVRNLVTYLLPLPAGGLPAEVSPGQSVGIPIVSTEVTHVVVEDPAAGITEIPVPAGANRVAYGETSRQGVYYVTQYSGEEVAAQEAFATNLFARAESLAVPSAAPKLPPAGAVVGAGTPGEMAGEGLFRRELWPVVVLVGVAVLLLEWLYAQRIAVRRAIVEWQNRRSARRLERM